MGKREIYLIHVLFLLLSCLSALTAVTALPEPARADDRGRVVRAGVYQNHPKVFVDEHGVPMGIFVDVLDEIARLENWRLTYVPGTWKENLQRLREGQIDLLVDVAESADRTDDFLLSRGWVLESWIDVYTLEDRRVRRIADLDGQVVAVLQGSIQEQFLSSEVVNVFGIRLQLLPLPDYAATVEAVRSRKADSLVASRFFYYSPHKGPGIVPNHLILYPGGLHVAFCRTGCEELANSFDSHLARMKDDYSSIYYASLRRWLQTPEVRRDRVPLWVILINVGVGSLLILAGAFTLLLRRQVRLRTRELSAANERLTGLNRELDRTVSELKRSLDEQRRLQDHIARIRKLESLGQLAGGVAHDFNNMIGVILGSVDLAREELPPDSPAATELDEIAGAARRSAELTRRLLAFARQQPATPRVLELNDAVADMVRMLRRLVGDHLELQWVPGDDLPPVFMDPSQLDQVLTNLVVNARDAIADTGTIRLETSRHPLPVGAAAGAGGPGVLLAVRDDGCGMAPELVERIFDPFFTTKPQGEGTGLGLATVFGIVAQNRGTIQVESRPGIGTSFLIFLPAHVEETVKKTVETEPASS